MKVATRPAKAEESFTTSFVVDKSPREAFDAINNVRAWWTGEIEGRSEKIGDEFTFRYQDLHRSRQRVVESVPGVQVAWLVTDAHLAFADDPAEWVGTRIFFDISKESGKTRLRFTHVGLSPECDCYEACHDGWTFYVQRSLRSLILTGKGEVT